MNKMNNMLNRKCDTCGQTILVVVVVFLFASLAIMFGFVLPVVEGARMVHAMNRSLMSITAAESGTEDMVYRLKNGMNVSSPETISINDGSAVITLVDTGGKKEITAEGDVDAHIRKLKTELITSIGASFSFGAQVGEGGLVMQQNTEIRGESGAVGNVHSNGSVVGASGAGITGDLTVSTNIEEDVQARSLVCNNDNDVGKSDPEIDYAQSFQADGSAPIGKVSIYIKKSGNPGSRTVRIVTDNAGSPSTTEVASGVLDSGLVGSGYSWIDIVFLSPPTLVDGATYWVVLDATEKSNKYWVWCSDSNNGFGNGVGKYKDDWSTGGAWTAIVGDLAFKVFLGSGESSMDTIAVGGDARAHTITNSNISGDAYYQTISGSSVGGTPYSGSADPAVIPMPLSDGNIADIKSGAMAGGTISGDCDVPSTCAATLGPVMIDGDLHFNGGTFTLTGTVYVTGNITSSNNVNVRCDATFGSDECVLIADGYIDIPNNLTLTGSGNPTGYIALLSTVLGCNGGAQQSSCGPSNSGIYISNNATGAIFYTTDSQIYINNNVAATAVYGYKLHLNNNATIEYELGILDTNFSSGPGGGWAIDKWEEVE